MEDWIEKRKEDVTASKYIRLKKTRFKVFRFIKIKKDLRVTFR
jgi:hypothetical protein